MLNGHTVLIVEAEFLVALDIQTMLESLSAGALLFARSPHEAHACSQQWPAIDLAIVELGDDYHTTSALLRGLHEAGAALIVTTADSTMQQGHPDFPDAPVILKPMLEEDFRRAIGAAVDQRT